MKRYLYPSGWALAMIGVGVAGMVELIDQPSMIALLAAMTGTWIAASGQTCSFVRRKV